MERYSSERESATLESSASEMAMLIYPRPKSTTSAFIIGPHIRTRTLNIPYMELQKFLQSYITNISICARNTMAVYPTDRRSRLMCLCVTEFVTKTWKSLYIKAEGKPSPLGLSWRQTSDDLTGRWNVYVLPCSSTQVIGGFGNTAVMSS